MFVDGYVKLTDEGDPVGNTPVGIAAPDGNAVGPTARLLLLVEGVGEPEVPTTLAVDAGSAELVAMTPVLSEASTLNEAAVLSAAVPRAAVPCGIVLLPKGMVLLLEGIALSSVQYPLQAPMIPIAPKSTPVTQETSVHSFAATSKLTAWQSAKLSQASWHRESVLAHRDGTMDAPSKATPQLMV